VRVCGEAPCLACWWPVAAHIKPAGPCTWVLACAMQRSIGRSRGQCALTHCLRRSPHSCIPNTAATQLAIPSSAASRLQTYDQPPGSTHTVTLLLACAPPSCPRCRLHSGPAALRPQEPPHALSNSEARLQQPGLRSRGTLQACSKGW